MSNKVKMSHAKKKTMARKMISKDEQKRRVGIFSSEAWRSRKMSRCA